MSKIQDIFGIFYPQYRENYRTSGEQAKAATSILNCKTARLGGRKYECENCGHPIIHYNSCRNLHGPSCQGVNKEFWVD